MIIAKAINLLVLLALTFWFGEAKSWQSFAAAAASVISLVILEIGSIRSASYTTNPDARLFRSFLDSLPFDGAIAFLQHQDFAEPVRVHALDELREFVRSWGDEAHRFHDRKLDKYRTRLRAASEEFLHTLAQNTFSVRNPEYCAVPTDWKEDNSALFNRVRKQLNDLADGVFRLHQEMVQYGRKRYRT